MSDRATFIASIAPIMSGIKTGGDGMRVQFDVSESEMGEAIKLVLMRGKLLKVTVETCTELNDETKKEAKSGAPRVDYRRSTNRRDK